ncbi:MAG: hypothetical protein ACYCUK_17925 [Thiomonas sp.]
MNKTPHVNSDTTSNTAPFAPREAHQTAVLEPIENIVLMSWAEWARTPKDYRLTSLYGQQGRWVMRAGPHGLTLRPVHITG